MFCKSYNFFIFFFVIFRLKAFCKGIIDDFLWQDHLDKLVNTFNQEQNDTNIDNLLKIVGIDNKAQHH